MKWIDMLKKQWAERGPFIPSRGHHFTDSNGFHYDCSITDKDVTIFVNNSHIGYQFSYTDKINWTHPEGAEALLSDEVKEHLNKFLEEE